MLQGVEDHPGSVARADLGHEIAAVGVDGEGADEEGAGDFFARPPIGDESENLFSRPLMSGASPELGWSPRATSESKRLLRAQK